MQDLLTGQMPFFHATTASHFDGSFPGGPGSAGFPLVFFLHLFWMRTFGDKWHRLLLSNKPSASKEGNWKHSPGDGTGSATW